MKKIVSIVSMALLGVSFSGSASAPIGYRAETAITATCPIEGKWQVISIEAGGNTMDVASEEMMMEFTGNVVKSTSKSLPASTDKFEIDGNAITVTDSKSEEKQVIEIMKCSSDVLVLKVVVEGMTMIENLKKI